MKTIKVKNTRRKTESVQVIATELYDASDLRAWAYEHAWSGARDRLEYIDKYAGGWELLFDIIEQEAYLDGIGGLLIGAVTDIYINNTIWFVDEILDDFDSVYELEESKTLKENLDRHVWEGWTVQDFIDELEPSFDMIMSGNSWQKPFKTKEEIKRWAADNQPYYKKSIPEVVSYFTNKLNKGFKESKTLRENKTELNEDYVLGIKKDYDTQWEFDTFILGNDQIIAHGSDDRNARYPIYEALTDLLREHGVDEDLFGTLTEVEELVEELGYYINRLTGYGQGDNYTLVTKEPIINSQHFEDIIFGGNHYTARLYKIGRGRLIQVDSVGGFHIPEPTVEDIYHMVQYFDVLPAYYQLIDIGSSYTSQEFREALDIGGLKDFDTLEESKKIKSRVNLTEGAFDELSYNYKEDLAALYSVASFMDYMEYNDEFGTKYKSKRAYERGLYQDLLHIIDGAKASGDLSKNDVYNVDDILNANAEFIDILAGILTYFNV